MAFAHSKKPKLVQTLSRLQKSIALSSYEADALASASGGTEGLCIGRLWNFLTKKDASVVMAADSSSGKKPLLSVWESEDTKHVDVKFVWMQKAIEDRFCGDKNGGNYVECG